jgi:hypothetical protein
MGKHSEDKKETKLAKEEKVKQRINYLKANASKISKFQTKRLKAKKKLRGLTVKCANCKVLRRKEDEKKERLDKIKEQVLSSDDDMSSESDEEGFVSKKVVPKIPKAAPKQL